MSDSTLTAAHAVSFARNAAPADYFALLKPRVMSLVAFTSAVGMVLAPGQLHPVLIFAALVCIAAGAGASGAINMWFDRDIDARMRGPPEDRSRLVGCYRVRRLHSACGWLSGL